MFESILSSSSSSSLSVSSSLEAVLVALVLGLVIGCSYMYACKKQGYGKDFIIGLVIIPAVVAAIIMLIGSDIAKALSLGGAFALVRFRSAPGSAKDISVVFFSMAAGLACGLGYVAFAALFVVIILLVLVGLSITNFADRNVGMKQLKITIPEDINYTEVFNDIFKKYLSHIELKRAKTTNMGTMFETTYIVKLKEKANEKELIDALRVRNGNLNISIGEITDNSTQLN